MFICIYRCPLCGSIVLESDEARRSSDYEVYCPMCEDSNGNDVRMGLAQTDNPDELETLCRSFEIGLSNLKNEVKYAGPKAKYRVHGCIDHGDHIEGLVENDRAEFWGSTKSWRTIPKNGLPTSCAMTTRKCSDWQRERRGRVIRITDELIRQFDHAVYKFCEQCEACDFHSEDVLPDGDHCLLRLVYEILAERGEKEKQ